MHTKFQGLLNYLVVNNIDSREDIVALIERNCASNAISISMTQNELYEFFTTQGYDETKLICLADEIIDWMIEEMDASDENIKKIAQYAIDNDMHPSAMDKLAMCDLSCLNKSIREAIENN
jgi:hypothetical protein